MPKPASESSEIVDEAIRAMSGVSQKTTEEAHQVIETTRSTLDQTAALNRKLVSALTSGLEANLKATFAVQTAMLSAGQAVVEAATGANKEAMGKWFEIAQTNQATLLEGFHVGAGLLPKFPAGLGPFALFEK